MAVAVVVAVADILSSARPPPHNQVGRHKREACEGTDRTQHDAYCVMLMVLVALEAAAVAVVSEPVAAVSQPTVHIGDGQLGPNSTTVDLHVPDNSRASHRVTAAAAAAAAAADTAAAAAASRTSKRTAL